MFFIFELKYDFAISSNSPTGDTHYKRILRYTMYYTICITSKLILLLYCMYIIRSKPHKNDKRVPYVPYAQLRSDTYLEGRQGYEASLGEEENDDLLLVPMCNQKYIGYDDVFEFFFFVV